MGRGEAPSATRVLLLSEQEHSRDGEHGRGGGPWGSANGAALVLAMGRAWSPEGIQRQQIELGRVIGAEVPGLNAGECGWLSACGCKPREHHKHGEEAQREYTDVRALAARAVLSTARSAVRERIVDSSPTALVELARSLQPT